jgi:hypothetical protein
LTSIIALSSIRRFYIFNYNIMETKKILAMLLATMLTVGTFGTTFADDD